MQRWKILSGVVVGCLSLAGCGPELGAPVEEGDDVPIGDPQQLAEQELAADSIGSSAISKVLSGKTGPCVSGSKKLLRSVNWNPVNHIYSQYPKGSQVTTGEYIVINRVIQVAYSKVSIYEECINSKYYEVTYPTAWMHRHKDMQQNCYGGGCVPMWTSYSTWKDGAVCNHKL
ncbi:MAG: hypothetical protein K1X89_08450 [Myxococcaceae bacterium]|nr:hypothetical protein [Myxococcaceae bacterium]